MKTVKGFCLSRPGVFRINVDRYTKEGGHRGKGIRVMVAGGLSRYDKLRADLVQAKNEAKQGLISWFKQRNIIRQFELAIIRVKMELDGWVEIILRGFNDRGEVSNGEEVEIREGAAVCCRCRSGIRPQAV